MTSWILGIMALLLLLTACTSAVSKQQPSGTGLDHKRLRPCPSSPNCVCSEFTGRASFIAPVSFTESPESAWSKATATVQEMGGTMLTVDSDYLHAVFTSRIFRFKDDLELRMDRENRIIHLRSASRTGYSDFGVNRKRAEQFRNFFTAERYDEIK